MRHLMRDAFWWAVPDGTDNYGQPIYGNPEMAWGFVEHSHRRITNRYGQEVVSTARITSVAPVAPDALIWLDAAQVGKLEAAQQVASVQEGRELGTGRKVVTVYL